MRLVCPKCGAQYDVPLEVIPEAGRDVQCSNCGHTWFQKRETKPAAERPRKPAVTTVAAQPEPEPGPESVPKRSIDPEMAELFREERDYEARQRAAEALETQPDLGLAEPAEDERARRARESRERMTRMRDAPQDPPSAAPASAAPRLREDPGLEAAAEAAAASRRDLLPDVEEINQTLRATSEPRVVDRGAARPVQETRPRETGSPFARGFMLTVVLAVLLVAAYALKPKIVETVPQAAPVLDAYTEAVDKGRVWLDGAVSALLMKLDSMSSEAEAPAEPSGN